MTPFKCFHALIFIKRLLFIYYCTSKATEDIHMFLRRQNKYNTDHIEKSFMLCKIAFQGSTKIKNNKK